MKAFVYFMIAAAVGVALCENDTCSTPVYEICMPHKLFPKDYPDTIKDLKQTCNDLQEFSSCYLTYFEACEDSVLNSAEFQNFLKFIQENCQEDSNAFQVISRNLDCFTPTMRSIDIECDDGFTNETEFQNLIKQAGHLLEDFDSSVCLESVWLITCETVYMEKHCGSELGEVLSNILINTDYDYVHYCKPEILSNLSLFIKAIELTLSDGKW